MPEHSPLSEAAKALLGLLILIVTFAAWAFVLWIFQPTGPLFP